MKRDKGVLIRQAIAWGCDGSREKPYQRIDHYIPDAVYFPGFHAFGLEIFVSVFRRCEQEIRKPVCNDPVDLLWHTTVKRT